MYIQSFWPKHHITNVLTPRDPNCTFDHKCFVPGLNSEMGFLLLCFFIHVLLTCRVQFIREDQAPSPMMVVVYTEYMWRNQTESVSQRKKGNARNGEAAREGKSDFSTDYFLMITNKAEVNCQDLTHSSHLCDWGMNEREDGGSGCVVEQGEKWIRAWQQHENTLM